MARPIPSISVKTIEDRSQKAHFDIRDWIRCVPDEYRNVTLDSCVDLKTSIIELGKNWANQRPLKSLYIYGDWGSGKTTFVYAILRYLQDIHFERTPSQIVSPYTGELERNFISPIYVKHLTGKDLDAKLLKASRYEDGDEYEIQNFSDCQILFIDDIDKVSGSQRLKLQIFEIINRRKITNKPTIITSNLAPSELTETFDGSVVSRMNDETKWMILKFPNGDLRKKKVMSKVIQL